MAYPSTPSDYGYSHPATITMGEMSLLTPTSPESLCSMNIKGEYRDRGEYDDQGEREDSPKQSRKRKSWGQELPTPKTNLPPRYAFATSLLDLYHVLTQLSRKRAKTEDEKEQRRIERVLRNRQAAQSSRERKRQEVEKLEGEKLAIERQNQLLRERLMAVEHEKFKLGQQIAKMTAEMSVFHGTSLSRGPSASPLSRAVSCTPSPEFDKDFLEIAIKQELEDHSYSASTPKTTIDPRSSGFSSLSPSEYSGSPSPPHFEFDLGITTLPDMAQHPAAMLCGLQCQSGKACRPPIRPTIQDEALRLQQSLRLIHANFTYLLCLMTISTVYSNLLRIIRATFKP